jgi:hypothetical protein
VQEQISSSGAVTLSQNCPNPFVVTTTIPYRVNTSGKVELKILDVLGNEVATVVNSTLQPGGYKVLFTSGDLPAGIYYYRLTSGTTSVTKKMILSR